MSRNRHIWWDSTPLHGPPRYLNVSTRWYLRRRNLKKGIRNWRGCAVFWRLL